jgi:hypothetical protein
MILINDFQNFLYIWIVMILIGGAILYFAILFITKFWLPSRVIANELTQATLTCPRNMYHMLS